VAYFDQREVEAEIDRVTENIMVYRDFLRGVDRDMLHNTVFLMLVMMTISLKHPAFREEREWRVVHLPLLFQSTLVTQSVETIWGTPHLVYRIPLQNFPDQDVHGVDLNDLADRVIIGPSAYPGPIASAYIAALFEAGVQDAARRVTLSNIPLRT
jgi:hypothetical protein